MPTCRPVVDDTAVITLLPPVVFPVTITLELEADTSTLSGHRKKFCSTGRSPSYIHKNPPEKFNVVAISAASVAGSNRFR